MRHLRRILCATLLAAAASAAQAGPYSNVFIFGDSLSDSGNNDVLLPLTTPVPVAGNGFIPTFPYAAAAPYPFQTYSNGPTWAVEFGAQLGVTILPSLLGGNNYAFGGATTSGGLVPSLLAQVGLFLGPPGPNAPATALYVIAGGGNNARDVIEDVLGGADPMDAVGAAAAAYASDTIQMIQALAAEGADDSIVWNVPNVGIAPAVANAFGTTVAAAMNLALNSALSLLPANVLDGVQVFDLFGLTSAAASNPAAFGLTNVTQACAANLPGAGTGLCTDPGTWLFWDGIHPTSGGHALIAREMLVLAVPVPATLPLLVLGIGAVLLVRRRC